MSDLTLDSISQETQPVSLRQYRGFLARYLNPQARRVALMACLLLASIALQLVNPQVIRYFLDTAQAGGAIRALMTAAGLFIAFSMVQQALSLAATLTSQDVGLSATNRLRADLALHCLRLDMPFHKRHTPGELIARIDGDVTQMANFFSQFTVRVLGNALLVLGILALLFRENAWVGLGMALYTAVTLLALGQIQKIAGPRWAAERQSGADLSGYLEERISGAEEIRAAGAEAYALRRLYALLRDFMEKRRVAFVISSLAFNLTNLIYVIGYAVGLALGVYLYMRGEASLGTAYLIVFYVGMLSDPLQALREQAQDLQQATASIRRVQKLLALRPEVGEPDGAPRSLPEGPLGVCFEQVTFGYEDNNGAVPEAGGAPGEGDLQSCGAQSGGAEYGGAQNGGAQSVLRDVSFDLAPGRVLGILGRTGSGKSTMTRLLFRLYDPTGGAIRLGGADLREAGLSDLRARVGMVTQDVQLFNATVRDNLTFFNPRVPDSLLESVLKTLRLWDWVQSLPEGLDTKLSAGGQGLSAGEAQLLAFTRVFLKNPGLVILDEASSRLDPATETLMERAVDRLFQGRTGVVIAHRLKTVQRADDILILEDGRVVEYGPREALARDPQSRFYSLLQTGLEEALA